MLVRLSKAKRLRAGRLVALIYLLCVLAPTLSLALPGSQAVSPCLGGAEHVPGMMHVHAASHVDADEYTHDHAMAHSHVDAPDHALSVQAPTVPEQTPSKGSHSSDGKCCSLSDVSLM